MLTNNAKNTNVCYTNRATYQDGKLICSTRKTTVDRTKDISQDYEMESNGLHGYKFPNYEDVPSGWYFSEIIHAEYERRTFGKDVVKVYYEIIPYPDCYHLAIGKISDDDVRFYHIIQVYPIGSTFYENLTYSMKVFLSKEKFKVKEIVGATEYVALNYENSKIGGFCKRTPITWEEYIDYCANMKRKEMIDKKELFQEETKNNSCEDEEYDYSYDW
ncbi:MAG: hypothetical protein II998_09535 [Clostridia bacterium]|nr:hypothetical protein [Clostridia bacterium]